MISEYLGSEQHYYIDGKNYKSFNEKGEFSQLYNSKTNIYHYIDPNSGEVVDFDASENAPNIISINHFDERKEILGYNCKRVVIISEASETEYWFSADLKVDPEVFKEHAFGEWATLLKETKGGLPLEYTVKTQYYNWSSTASLVEKKEFLESEFDLKTILNEE